MTKQRFAVCVDDRLYPASLENRKVYAVITDRRAERHGLLRVIDESGEDYLYSKAQFVPVRLSAAAKRAFSS